MESDVITLQDIFVARAARRGADPSSGAPHRLLSPLRRTGLKPHFLEKLAANGVVLPPGFFSPEDARAGAARRLRGASFEGAFE